MFVHSTCRSCGGPLLLGSGTILRKPPQPGWWLDAPPWHPECPVKMYPGDAEEQDLRHSLRQLAAARTEEMAAKWEQRCRDLEDALRARLNASPPRLLEAAMRYAQWGWPVFPLVEGRKNPATKNGFKDATTDVARIEAYWKTHPMANIGIATGHTFDVIDVDVPKMKDGKLTPDGRDVFAKLLAQVDVKDGRGPLPDCYGINKTPTGGTHLLVLPTGAGNRGGLLPGIDTRGIGGYIVAPPSQRPEGRYRWEVAPAPKVKRNG